jgi:hypothetical protein
MSVQEIESLAQQFCDASTSTFTSSWTTVSLPCVQNRRPLGRPEPWTQSTRLALPCEFAGHRCSASWPDLQLGECGHPCVFRLS